MARGLWLHRESVEFDSWDKVIHFEEGTLEREYLYGELEMGAEKEMSHQQAVCYKAMDATGDLIGGRRDRLRVAGVKLGDV